MQAGSGGGVYAGAGVYTGSCVTGATVFGMTGVTGDSGIVVGSEVDVVVSVDVVGGVVVVVVGVVVDVVVDRLSPVLFRRSVSRIVRGRATPRIPGVPYGVGTRRSRRWRLKRCARTFSAAQSAARREWGQFFAPSAAPTG